MSESIITLAEVAGFIPGARLVGEGATPIASVCTDARTAGEGVLFVGLKGEKFDGTDFAGQAAGNGAAAVLVSREIPGLTVPQIVVPDTGRAFCESAAGWRSKFSIPVITVSGSNGKTTTTQMIASILRAAFGEESMLATRGNFNNSVGVPITLWRLRAGQKAAVVEAGMSHPGEMAELAAMIRPTVALVNNAQREHQEFLSGVEATAVENSFAIRALGADGVAVYPADDACAGIWKEAAGNRRTITFATTPGVEADVKAGVKSSPHGIAVKLETPEGGVELEIGIGGLHNGHNAAAAASCALAAGIPLSVIAKGLSSFSPVARRGVRHVLSAGTLVIDDTYNANPDSMEAGIEVLAGCAGPRVLVAGDMGEVGSKGPEYHEEVGRFAAQRGIERLFCCGDLMRHTARAFGPAAQHFESLEALEAAVLEALPSFQGGTLLVKASNFMHFDRIVKAVLEADAKASQSH